MVQSTLPANTDSSTKAVDAPAPRPRRVLLLAPQPFFINRGTPIAVRAVVEALVAEGYEVDLLVYHLGAEVAIPGCRVLRIPRVPGIGEVRPGLSMRKIACDAVMMVWALKLLLCNRYIIIHAVEESVFMAMLLGPMARTPYVYDMDSSMVEQIGDTHAVPRWLQRALLWMEGLGVRRARGTIACCKALAELSQRYAPNNPVVVLEDVSLLNFNSPDSVQMPDGLAGPIIMYVGNLEIYQGIDLLLESFALAREQVTDANLAIIGGTSAHIEHYRRKAAQLGIAGATHLLGPRPVEQLGQYLARATVVVSPRNQGHNTPMKIYSYLDCGKPLLATRLPTHTQVLDDQIACLTAPEPAAMAAGLVRLLGDEAYRRQLASAAKRRVQECYTPAVFRAKLSAFYHALTDNSPNDAATQSSKRKMRQPASR